MIGRPPASHVLAAVLPWYWWFLLSEDLMDEWEGGYEAFKVREQERAVLSILSVSFVNKKSCCRKQAVSREREKKGREGFSMDEGGRVPMLPLRKEVCVSSVLCRATAVTTMLDSFRCIHVHVCIHMYTYQNTSITRGITSGCGCV